MTRVQPDAQFVYICGKGNDDGRPYVALIDADGYLITVGGAAAVVDAADVTYTPAVAGDWDIVPAYVDHALDELAARITDVQDDIIPDSWPCRAKWFHDNSFVVTGNAITVTVDGTQFYNFRAAQTAAANGDVFTGSCVLKPGAYTIALLGRVNNSSGLLDISFKHTNDAGYTSIVTGQDWYAAVAAQNTVKTATFTVLTGGRHIFKFTVNGKNGASSAYNINLTCFDVYLTAGDA